MARSYRTMKLIFIVIIVAGLVKDSSCLDEYSNIVHSIEDSNQLSFCYDHQGKPLRCIPEFVNAAFNVRVEATNTCGTRGPTEYCVQTGVTGATKSCEICDASVPHLAHPPEYLTDFNNNDNQTWWQSETMLEGVQYPNQVNLTLHLGKAFDITYVRLKFHTSRPESFAIYKRTREDGDWIPYQYYSATCRGTYGIESNSFVSKEDETQALCTSEFSDISPLTGGNVAFSTLEGRPSAYDFEHSPVLQEWVTATDIRIVLDRVNTFGDEIFGDFKVLKSYYYGVSDFAVGGRCKCNGHASKCVVGSSQYNPWERRLVCQCEHNTAGADCEQCLPFYNDQPWARTTATNIHECKPCNCNGRSNKCYFDHELWTQTGHGGHCTDCIDNTDGAHCERCKENFYQREDGRCIPCNCDSIGSRHLQCNSNGQCPCKPGVDGQRCHKCAENFYDFTSLGCRPCGCNVAGSVENKPSCDHVTGICRCKDNVEGQRCDQCKPGYFDLQAENEFGCLPCFCFGHSSICRSAVGYSAFSIETGFYRDNERWIAEDYNGKDIPTQHHPVTQDITVTAPSREPVYFIAPARYLGDQRSSYNQNLRFRFRVGEEGPQATLEDIVLEGASLTISLPIFSQGNPMPTMGYQDYAFRLHEHSAYGWNPRLSSHDFITIISNLTAVKIKATYTPRGTAFLDNVALDTAQRSPIGPDATWIEMCTCPEGYVGQFCESCAPGFRNDPPGGGRFARCVPCNCHGHAEYCDPETGRCICQHNTAGDNCERCAPGFYGNAVLETPDACQPCPCPENGACVILPNEQVACLECPEGYAGHRCNLCVDGYYGEPADSYDQALCRRCECNGNIDPNAVGSCDRVTGECLKCVNNTTGRHCELCKPGYFGDALKEPKGDCKACNCFPRGTTKTDSSSDVLVCDYGSGQCPCLPNVRGLHCDICEEGFWNIASGNGCDPCNCNHIGSTGHSCDINTGQCVCHPGVIGQHCDQCLPYHSNFSVDGCKACECDTIGSLSAQCNGTMHCECRPNVEGLRCERCKENTYNKAAGCIDCPPCYNLVQDAANAHRAKMAELAELLEAIQKNPHLVDDENFLRRLEEVHGRVNALLEDARTSAGVDGNLVGKLKDLHRRLIEIQKSAGVVAQRIDEAKGIGQFGEQNITVAEDIIKRAQEALSAARKFLETEGIKALEDAIERSKDFGQKSERMSEIAREARNHADRQEQEAKEIEGIALSARNTSKEAFEKANKALQDQVFTSENIRQLERNLTDTEVMLKRAKELAQEAKQKADKVYDEALDLYTDVNSIVLPDIDPSSMRDRASDIIAEAKRFQEKINGTVQDNDALLEQLQKQKEDAEGLLQDGERQRQIADEMFAEVDEALNKAKDAVAAGEETLAEARQTLETLEAFDLLVQESKGKADEALSKIPSIEQLIEDAEAKTESAEEGLSGAKLGAGEARSTAQEAQNVAEKVSENAHSVRDEADQTKDKANKLKAQGDELAGQVETTNERISEYEDRAADDEQLAKEALEQANQAKISATDASVQVKNALDTVEDILRALDGLDDIDTSLLDELETRLDQAERELKEADFEPRMAQLRQAREHQNHWMRDYTEEIKKLEKDVANIADIKAALPDKCYRSVVLEP